MKKKSILLLLLTFVTATVIGLVGCTSSSTTKVEFEDIQAKNEKLEQRAKELEEQNKKLRLLLAESNKNLNSYKPSMFGLYKKVNPQ